MLVDLLETELPRIEAGANALRRARANVARHEQAVIDAATLEGERVSLGELLREPLRNGHSAPKSQDGRGVRVFSLTAVTEGDFSERNTKVAAMDAAKVEQLWAEPGDIFVQRSNTPELVGTARMYRGEHRFAVFPDLLIRVRAGERVLPAYLELVLRSSPVRQYFRAAAQGIAGSMPKIDQGTIAQTVIPVPAIPRQAQVVARVHEALERSGRLAATLDVQVLRARRLRLSLLHHALTGQMALVASTATCL